MRVIAGSARGCRLETPRGLNTRPTTDRVKESIFNIIQFDIPGRQVLDLFAGSGQMGIECLSRGAAGCVFVDGDRQAQQVIRRNLAAAGLADKGLLLAGDSFAALERLADRKFGLILLDPPYGGQLLNRALDRIRQIDILLPGGIIVCESAREDQIQPVSPPYRLKKRYQYGATAITTLTREGEMGEPQ